MTKEDIIRTIAMNTGLRQTDVKQVVQMLFDNLVESLATDRRIELRNFGVFEVITRKARKARNPKTGEEIMVPERKGISFKPGKVMLEMACNR